MEYATVVEALGDDYVDRPVEFGTEADLRCRLVSLLEDSLSSSGGLQASLEDLELVGRSPSYKVAYRRQIESRLRDRGTIGRIRLDVSVDKGENFDVAVFGDELHHPIQWVRNGSKRFDARDLEAVVSLKFIKNKCYPPTNRAITDDALLDPSLQDLEAEFNPNENGLASDIAELRTLDADVERFFVLVSNNNYLFADPITESEADEAIKRRVGAAARQWLAGAADDVSIRYVHPLGSTWVSE